MKPLEERYLNLIDSALAVPLEDKDFGAFLESALEYLYGAGQTGMPATDLHRAEDRDAMFQADRIARLFEASQARGAVAQDPEGLATLTVGSTQVAGNAAAAAMFSCAFPCTLDRLPIDADLREAIAEVAAHGPSLGAPQLILAQLELASSPISLAVLRPIPSGGVQVTFSFVDWSEARVVRFANALGLTPSEREVLRGYLQGLTRREIAGQRGTSEETVKAQSKSILQKTGCARVADLVPLATTLAFVLDAAPLPSPPASGRFASQALLRTLDREGRRVEYRVYGKGDRTLLFMHGQPVGPFFTEAFLKRMADADVQIVAPSRPGYGGTGLPLSSESYLETVRADAAAVVAAVGARRLFVAGHQLGGTYALDFARAFAATTRGVIFLNAGAPVDETVYASMDRWSRLIATGIRHAPSVVRMALSLGLGDYKRRSAETFVHERYRGIPEDAAALEDPETVAVNVRGVEHMIAQDAVAFIDDQKLKLSDWSALYAGLEHASLWVIPEACRIMPPEHVARFAASHSAARIHRMAGAGSLGLYSHGAQMAERVVAFMNARDARDACDTGTDAGIEAGAKP